MKIEIIKDYKCLKAGDAITVDTAYGEILIKKGVAKKAAEPKVDKK